MHFQSINPFNQEKIAGYEVFDRRRIAISIEQAEQGFNRWKKTSFAQRSVLLLEAAQLLRQEKKQHAGLITREMGKHLSESLAEVEKCAWACEYYAQNGERLLSPRYVPFDKNNKETAFGDEAAAAFDPAIHSVFNKIVYEPIGAVFAIMPWNFPYWQVFRFATAALTAGNVALLKHSPNVCGCALAIQDLFKRAGFPAGVFQTLFLDLRDTDFVVKQQIVQAVTLTGSEKAGTAVAAIAGRHLKKSVLELGGSDPVLILDDADLDRAAKVAVESRMLNAGQSCIAAKRFIATKHTFDDFAQKVLYHVRRYRQGNPLDPRNNMGSMARLDLADNIWRQMNESVEQGATLVYGGERDGCNVHPTLLLEVKPSMPVGNEETFGPLASVFRVKDEKALITLANRTRYGLGASIWSQDRERAERFARQIEAGTVAINGMVKSDPRLPFGGVKKSGYGRELAEEGVKEFTNVKVIAIA
jgi:succinate-semialdehyde dehydrogenase/glutarate-semialdehyde dehydrogenase